jgi:hypothetical protein
MKMKRIIPIALPDIVVYSWKATTLFPFFPKDTNAFAFETLNTLVGSYSDFKNPGELMDEKEQDIGSLVPAVSPSEVLQ